MYCGWEYLLAGQTPHEPRPRVLGPFVIDNRKIVEICMKSVVRQAKCVVDQVRSGTPLCVGDRRKWRMSHGAQPEGRPEETEYKEKQCGSFQGRWSGWVEAGVACPKKGGARSSSGRSLILSLDVESERRFCSEWDIVVVGHRRRRLRASRSPVDLQLQFVPWSGSR